MIAHSGGICTVNSGQLRPLAARALAKYPQAEAAIWGAVGLVLSGAVQPLAPSPLFRDDRWRVDGAVCSIRGGSCDCGAADAVQADGGPLCVHRLAAMFARLVHQAHGARHGRLAELLAGAMGKGLRLYVRVGFTYDTRREQENTVTGFFVEGDQVVTFGHGDQFTFTFAELAGELFAAGYMLERKGQNGGGSSAWRNEVWYLAPAQVSASSTAGDLSIQAATHAGLAAADPAGFVPRRLQVARMGQGGV